MAFHADREPHDQPPVRSGGYGPPSDLRGYLALLWRRKWIILPFLILTPLVAHLQADGGTVAFDASSQVLLNRQSQNLSGLGDPAIFDPARTIRTQAEFARLPEIAERVVSAARLDWDPGAFLAESSVDSDDQIDLLTFRVRDASPTRATQLANLYAEKYIEYRREIDTDSLTEALRSLTQQMDRLREEGLSTSGAFGALAEKQQQLQTAKTLQGSNALLVRRATGAGEVGNQASRTELLALAAGIIIGLGLAFLVDALDTRVREPEELVEELRLPLLGNLPEPRRFLRRRGALVMLEAPNSPAAEMFRILRSTLDVTALGEDCRSIMVTSAVEAEGKSTTAANLAVALARAGRHVILIDLDLRRPSVERLFHLPVGAGVTDVAFREVPLEEVLTPIPLGPRAPEPRRLRSGLGIAGGQSRPSPFDNGGSARAVLEVIGSGRPALNAGDFLVASELDVVLERLRHRADVLIVDGPPLLLSADALTLSAKIDALLFVAQIKTFRREYVGELKRVLRASPALKLGLVVSGGTALRRHPYYQALPPRETDRHLVT
jgi:Mrp family chromosome partitioning ATPase/capsular polysaccharide biosynthesis protein